MHKDATIGFFVAVFERIDGGRASSSPATAAAGQCRKRKAQDVEDEGAAAGGGDGPAERASAEASPDAKTGEKMKSRKKNSKKSKKKSKKKRKKSSQISEDGRPAGPGSGSK